MRVLVLAPFALLLLGAMAEPDDTARTSDAARKCPPPVVAVKKSDKPGSGLRKLNEEPPAMLIAAVHKEVDGCPVMLVLNGGGTGVDRGWTPAPESGIHPAE
ncbi:hypothetical protein D1610_12140 [Sphingomonas gilva]|uniref:Uncharacterized protein n=1 Tax=Sphingomonas gilva TaxID=2305907 RepID=A0A396RUA7_9SPHN|nr:hypothetical protein [Sphingomonas gilva]RHW17281.1 hypothetical protein D1610_12140 [Sphingomonas gilva]